MYLPKDVFGIAYPKPISQAGASLDGYEMDLNAKTKCDPLPSF